MGLPRCRQHIKSFSELGNLLTDTGRKTKRNNPNAPSGSSNRHAVKTDGRMENSAISLPEGCDDGMLFRMAVGDVVPLQTAAGKRRRRLKKKGGTRSEHDAKVALRALVATGEGFVVSQTPEYMEGRGYGVSPVLVRRLHKGDFSVQAHIDLHGHRVQDACRAVDAFLEESIGARRRVVLVIHGRGLSSPGRPVLKGKLRDWLSTGRWRKWVLAFTSARAEDGGAGATYVLLRTRPAGKSERRGCSFVR